MRIKSILLAFFTILTFVYDVMGQAKQPTIMVVPSDIWCIRNGFYTEVNIDGETIKSMDYAKALQENSDIRVLISKMGDIMASKGFPIESMEQRLKDLATDKSYLSLVTSKADGSSIQETEIDILNRIAQPDIIMDLDYEIKRIGPKKQISFNLTAIDAYSKKIISGNTGVGSEANVPITTLLEEAVLSYMDNFVYGLQNHFNDMFAKGRIIDVELKVFDNSAIDFETEFDYNGQLAELAEIIYVWFEDNTVEGRFNEKSRTATSIIYDQVRMPMMGKSLSGKERAMDASRFVNSLALVSR